MKPGVNCQAKRQIKTWKITSLLYLPVELQNRKCVKSVDDVLDPPFNLDNVLPDKMRELEQALRQHFLI